jgi:hypothetical protein
VTVAETRERALAAVGAAEREDPPLPSTICQGEAAVLGPQRSAGNQAVGRLLTRRPSRSGSAAADRVNALGRVAAGRVGRCPGKPGAPCGCRPSAADSVKPLAQSDHSGPGRDMDAAERTP